MGVKGTVGSKGANWSSSEASLNKTMEKTHRLEAEKNKPFETVDGRKSQGQPTGMVLKPCK